MEKKAFLQEKRTGQGAMSKNRLASCSREMLQLVFKISQILGFTLVSLLPAGHYAN